jgi:2-succinyl-5-enolpyruvyl-6-hydroxy-3-cyclohexene-1-carboxylate synthase
MKYLVLLERHQSYHCFALIFEMHQFSLTIDSTFYFIIRVGKPVISKKLNQWLKKTDAFQILVQNNDKAASK